MFEWLSQPGVVFWLAIAVMCVTPWVFYYIREMKRDERETELKREMIARGMSADEIERVLKASASKQDE
jgi:hypothetical protein